MPFSDKWHLDSKHGFLVCKDMTTVKTTILIFTSSQIKQFKFVLDTSNHVLMMSYFHISILLNQDC